MPIRLLAAISRSLALASALLIFFVSSSCPAEEPAIDWAIALHGGAGRLDKNMSPEMQSKYEESLSIALKIGQKVLSDNGTALDAVEATVVALENASLFNAGKGAAFTRTGEHELDASIMDGATRECGGIAMVRQLKNPVIAARLVMEKTPHVLLCGPSADQFGKNHGCELVEQSYFYTDLRFQKLQTKLESLGMKKLKAPGYALPARTDEKISLQLEPYNAHWETGGTVGCVALDREGNLSAATSTGGLTGKLAGRIGDSPINGAGNYANGFVAVSGTGKGEQFIRHSIAARVAWLVERKEYDLHQAVQHCLTKVLSPGDGGIIAVDSKGNISMDSTTGNLPRGCADSSGRFEVGVWFDRD